MAVRTISTRLAIDGEAEYKNAVSRINSELKAMTSALKLVEAQYRGNANSLDALTAKGEALSRAQVVQTQKIEALQSAWENAQKAQQTYADRMEKTKAEIADVEKEMSEMGGSAGKTSEEQKKLTDKLGELNKKLQDAESRHEAAARGVANWERQLNNAKIEQIELAEAVEKNNQYLDEARASADKCATSIDNYGNETKQAKEESQKFGKSSKDAVGALASALAAAGVAATIREISKAIMECLDASMEFESAMAGVYKTVNGTDEQLAAISEGIKKMSLGIPATTTEIAGVAEAAGQLGIATEEVLSFSRVMIDLGESTNLSADEAATALARFSNITGTSADNYDRLGAVIVGLGNNFATTEAEIVEMATRLASAGTLAGLSEANIMALATAMSSVGIEAEAGGTAMTQTLSAIEKAVVTNSEELFEFARIAGMTAGEFSTAWKNEPIIAIQNFIAGLGRLNEQGESAVIVLDDLGLSGIRQSNMLKSMALAYDTMTGAVSMANKAWEENTALTEEAAKRYATTESKVKMAKNVFEQLKVSIGDALAPALRNLADAGTSAFSWASDFVEKNPWLVQAITGTIGAMSMLALAIAGVATWVKVAVPAIQAFNAAIASSPIGLTTVVVTALVGALVGLAMSMSGADDETKKLLNSVKESREEYEKSVETIQIAADSNRALADSIVNLADKESITSAEKQELARMVEELKQKVPGLTLEYDEQANSLNMTAEAILDVVDADEKRIKNAKNIERRMQLEAEEAQITENLARAKKELRDASEELGSTTNPFASEDLGTIAALEQKVRDLTHAQEENAVAWDEANSKVERFSETLGYVVDENSILTAETLAGADEIIAKFSDLETAYNEAYAAAYESISSQIGLWDEMDNSAKTSVESLIQATSSQIDYLRNYSDNLDSLSKRNIDGIDLLVASLSDGSQESAAALAGLREASDMEIRALVMNLKLVEDGKQNFSEQVAAMETDFDENMKSMENRVKDMVGELDQYTAAYYGMQQTGQGAVDGLEPKVREVEELMRRLQQAQSKLWGKRFGSQYGDHRYIGLDGSFAGGLDYVPWDGYIAELHKGERVLTAEDARKLDEYIEASVPRGIGSLTQSIMPMAGPGATTAGAVGGDTFYITIDAKSVREFNDVVKMAQGARQARRARGI